MNEYQQQTKSSLYMIILRKTNVLNIRVVLYIHSDLRTSQL